ncbi:prepilin-type N-terminal cleavage/methylation domain-containing protein [Tamlana sp. 2_MG-2023]|uniref:PulJ/GspJ family protein n=1 Tax=unclassified Tamlana TaxID=2614803 RepID=UPI0026E457C2|nr:MULTISPECIES: prepilin-type N-terminal cleavage/methylation domain-containing protein [unclassified Tamlana]MDO6758568.1 prepilin-type N-terminal cleavage/methylation domain-containing protein [Tamlana sp. 2_MG-2023]MDO6789267.1 prepilin-type N-terminal cleavage/methylation domain-containing protein [Tamlana sp. 1_MG-2023]
MLVIKKHSNQKAFTVTELVVGMAISSIIISMVYLIYTNITRQITVYTFHQAELMEYNQFQNVLAIDVKMCRQLSYVDHKHIKLNMATNDIDYFFREGLVIRKSMTQDTFKIKVKEIALNTNEYIHDEYKTIRLTMSLLGEDVMVFEEKKIALAEQLNNFFLDGY